MFINSLFFPALERHFHTVLCDFVSDWRAVVSLLSKATFTAPLELHPRFEEKLLEISVG